MKTSLQNGIIFYLNTRGQTIGFINELNEYITKRDSTKGQMFLNPKYLGAMAIDLDLVQDLIRRRVKLIRIKVLGFERTPFWATITPHQFIEQGDRFRYDKRNSNGQNYTGYSEQIRLPLNRFIRQYDGQRCLIS